jgi:thiol-disulfide isomerase/thioredoxin
VLPVALAAASLVAASGLAGCLEGSLVGQRAPSFTLVTSAGARVNESSFPGRFVILDLMATWCAPCRLEAEHLKQVQSSFGDRVVILSIGADPTETDAQLDAFAQQHGATWPHGLDHDGSIGRAYRLGTIPKLVIVGPDGRVAFEREGEVLPAAIASVVAPASALPAPGAPLVATTGSALLAAAVGFLAVLQPYRRFHRDGGSAAPSWLALAALAGAGALAWLAAGFVSSRATYGSLALGAVTLGAVGWWIRARRGAGPTGPAAGWLQAADRVYEASPHAALAVVLALSTAGGAVAYAAVVGALLLGYALGVVARPRFPPESTVAPGLVGLALAGGGLLLFGARILVASA